MDLRTFVSETIQQIVGGIADAQKSLPGLGSNARINPALVSEGAKGQHAPPTPVEFDVALTVMESSSSRDASGEERRSGMVAVVSAEQASGNARETEAGSMSEAFSRVRFSVMVAQPADIETYRNTVATIGSRRSDFAGFP